MSATIVDQRQKMLKLNWLKCSEKVPKKRNLDRKINDLKPHICSLAISFRFSQRKSETNKTSKRDRSFYKTVQLKKFHLFYEPQLTQHSKKIYSRSIAKNLTQFTNFPTNMYLVGVRKNICTAPFLYTQEMHCLSTWKPNVFISL